MPSQTSCLALTVLSAAPVLGVSLLPSDGTVGPGGPGPLICSGLPRPHGRRRSRDLGACRALPVPPGAHPHAGLAPGRSLSPSGRHGAVPLPPPGGGGGPRADGGSGCGRIEPGPGPAAAPSGRSSLGGQGRGAGALPPRRAPAAFRGRLPGGSGLCSAAGSLGARQRPPCTLLPFPSLPPLSLPSSPCPPAAAGPAAPHAPRHPPQRLPSAASARGPARPAHVALHRPRAVPPPQSLSPHLRGEGPARCRPPVLVPPPASLWFHMPGVESALLTSEGEGV